MNEYQKFVADKTRTLIDLMTKIGQRDHEVKKLLEAMQPRLDRIVEGTVPLPTGILDGWALYFSPDGPDGIFDAYPSLVEAKAVLAWVLDYADMDSYLTARKKLAER